MNGTATPGRHRHTKRTRRRGSAGWERRAGSLQSIAPAAARPRGGRAGRGGPISPMVGSWSSGKRWLMNCIVMAAREKTLSAHRPAGDAAPAAARRGAPPSRRGGNRPAPQPARPARPARTALSDAAGAQHHQFVLAGLPRAARPGPGVHLLSTERSAAPEGGGKRREPGGPSRGPAAPLPAHLRPLRDASHAAAAAARPGAELRRRPQNGGGAAPTRDRPARSPAPRSHDHDPPRPRPPPAKWELKAQLTATTARRSAARLYIIYTFIYNESMVLIIYKT